MPTRCCRGFICAPSASRGHAVRLEVPARTERDRREVLRHYEMTLLKRKIVRATGTHHSRSRDGLTPSALTTFRPRATSGRIGLNTIEPEVKL